MWIFPLSILQFTLNFDAKYGYRLKVIPKFELSRGMTGEGVPWFQLSICILGTSGSVRFFIKTDSVVGVHCDKHFIEKYMFLRFFFFFFNFHILLHSCGDGWNDDDACMLSCLKALSCVVL